MAELFLTKQGTWRKQVNARQGFPPDSGDDKTRVQELLRRFSAADKLRAPLARVRELPLQPRYPDAQWRVLEALLNLLPQAAAQLQLVFMEHGEVDYAEVALRALQALGTPDAPTDLNLTLDYRLRHILVDEFQDTSVNQIELLKRLTAGWEPGDGRSLFLVGDPMQSIYRSARRKSGCSCARGSRACSNCSSRHSRCRPISVPRRGWCTGSTALSKPCSRRVRTSPAARCRMRTPVRSMLSWSNRRSACIRSCSGIPNGRRRRSRR